MMGKYEYELQALEGAGLSDVDRDAALTLVLGFVEASARATTITHASRRGSGQTDRQWWRANSGFLARVLDPAAYPTASRVGSAAGAAHGTAYDPDHAYAFGLDRVLDGLAVLIARSAKQRRRPVSRSR